MRKYLLPLSGLVMLATANGAFAASATSNFNVKVTVNPACTVSATDLDFGSFLGSIPALTPGSTSATVTCNKNVAYALSFSSAAAPVGATTATMANPGGATIPASLTVLTTSQTANGSPQTIAINGTIVAAVTNPAVGTYTVAQGIFVLY